MTDTASETLRPFRIDVPESDLADLRRRLHNVRWPEPATVADWSQGVPLHYLQDLCHYWAESYDWRSTEARINRLPSSAPPSTGSTSTSCTSDPRTRTRSL